MSSTDVLAMDKTEEESSAAAPDGRSTGKDSYPDGRDGLVRDAPPTLASFHQQHDFWHTFAGVAGNVLEWYDFAIFGFFSETIGQVFFPNAADPVAQSFAVFGGAFLFRPVGGILMGYVGDVYGRERALRASIFLMAFPTFAMGCLPSYDQVGNIAVVLLIFIRILQGLSVGGQLMSSLVYTLEPRDPAHWGLYGSFVMAAANFGTLLGNLVATLLQASLTPAQLESWGWRLPFWSGILVSLSGFYLRSSADGDAHRKSNDDAAEPTTTVPSNPLRLALSRANRRSLLASAMVPCLWSAGFYLSFVWMATYMHDKLEPPVPHSFTVNAMALLVSVCLFFPLAGHWSDVYGRRRVMTVGGVSLGLLAPLLLFVIRQGDPTAALGAQIGLGVSLSLWGAPMTAWLVESFDPAARLTSVAIGYNLAQATAGGGAPLVATLLTDGGGRTEAGYVLTALAVVALSGLWWVAPSSSGHGRFAPAPTVELTSTTVTTAKPPHDADDPDDNDHGLL
jgi:MHS family proline/betaine transporter-like MFS transporter